MPYKTGTAQGKNSPQPRIWARFIVIIMSTAAPMGSR